jgi:two-component system, OmpR family, sensor histidine kinase KdpD
MKLGSVSVAGITRGAAEVVAGVAVAIGLVALLDIIAPVTGLSVVPLLVVVALAIRRGLVPALAAAVLSVLALNFFFIEPRYRLTISESENVVALVVYLIVAVVVARLAAYSRERAHEAEARAHQAAAREREAAMLATVARSLLAEGSVDSQLDAIAARVADSLGARSAAISLSSAPATGPGRRAVRLPLRGRSGWLVVEGGDDPGRIAEPLGRLIDVALERERVAVQAADAEAAQRADVAKTAVLHAISHDLRSPLTAIATAAEGLRDPETSAEDRADLAEVVHVESERLARLVDDLLDLSRIEAGAVHPQRDWTDLREVVARASEQVVRSRGRHPIEMVLPADLPLVRADAVQLERVFVNLLGNAVKFSPPGAPVVVRGGVGGGRVTVRVIDRGPGVPAAQRAHVFEPFFRGRDSATGAGLGLAIARGLVEANGGRVVLQSATPGETAFAVSLPLEPVAAVR